LTRADQRLRRRRRYPRQVAAGNRPLLESTITLDTVGQTKLPKSSVNPSTRLLYDCKSAAQQLSISVRALGYLIQQQRIATRRIGKRVLIPHAELVRFARGNHTDPICRPNKAGDSSGPVADLSTRLDERCLADPAVMLSARGNVLR
jgi:hypothetical protein